MQTHTHTHLDLSALNSLIPSAGPQIWTTSSRVSFNKSEPDDEFKKSVLFPTARLHPGCVINVRTWEIRKESCVGVEAIFQQPLLRVLYGGGGAQLLHNTTETGVKTRRVSNCGFINQGNSLTSEAPRLPGSAWWLGEDESLRQKRMTTRGETRPPARWTGYTHTHTRIHTCLVLRRPCRWKAVWRRRRE